MRLVLADVDRFCVQSESRSGGLPISAPTPPALGPRRPEVRLRSELPRRRPRTAGLVSACLRFFQLSPTAPCSCRHTLRGEEAAVLHAFARIKTTIRRAGRGRAAPPGSLPRGRASLAANRLRHHPPLGAAESTPSRAPTSTSPTRLATRPALPSGHRCVCRRSRFDHGGHTRSSRRSSVTDRVRPTCRIFTRGIAEAFLTRTGGPCAFERELDDAFWRSSPILCGVRRLGAAARALVAAIAARSQTLYVIGALLSGDAPVRASRQALPPWHDLRCLSAAYGAAAAWRTCVVRRRPVAQRRLRRPGRERRQPAHRAASARRRWSNTIARLLFEHGYRPPSFARLRPPRAARRVTVLRGQRCG